MSPGRSIQAPSRISLATLSDARQSPVGVVGSLLLHVGIIGATLFTFAHKLDITQESAPVVPVELVTIANKTNIIAMVKAPPKVEPKPEEPTPPQPQKLESTPPQKAEAAPTKPEPEKLTAPPEPKPREAPPPPPENVAPEPAPKPPPMPKIAPRPEPKVEASKEAAKKDKFDIDNVMALLDKREAAQKSSPNARVADKTIKGFGAQTAMTMDLVAAIQSQMAECYTPPVGAPHPEDLVVDFDLFLNEDGSIARPPQLTPEAATAASSNTYTRASAEAARRAIYQCAPFKLPRDKYSLWGEIKPFHFDPRQMMGLQ